MQERMLKKRRLIRELSGGIVQIGLNPLWLLLIGIMIGYLAGLWLQTLQRDAGGGRLLEERRR